MKSSQGLQRPISARRARAGGSGELETAFRALSRAPETRARDSRPSRGRVSGLCGDHFPFARGAVRASRRCLAPASRASWRQDGRRPCAAKTEGGCGAADTTQSLALSRSTSSESGARGHIQLCLKCRHFGSEGPAPLQGSSFTLLVHAVRNPRGGDSPSGEPRSRRRARDGIAAAGRRTS